jgi:ferrous iron transport protein A
MAIPALLQPDLPARPEPSLADLAPGARAVVVEVDDSTPAGRRLLDLGLVPGTAIRVLRRAPLGDPVEYELRGYRLCLRRREAARVRVRLDLPAVP